MDIIFILLAALSIDLVFGDPPNRFHPVAWIGTLISVELKAVPREKRGLQVIYGIFIVLLTTALFTIGIYFLIIYLSSLNEIFYIIISAVMLKCTFSIRGLKSAARKVERFISREKLPEARQSLTSLVSRNTASLNTEQVIAATVESVAENSCDSIVAPLFYFCIFGVPGAVAYRIINTYDSMIGYHGKWEYAGKFAARFDDVLNFIPSRITALLLIASSWICKSRPSDAWSIMVRDHNKTESPNAGWTMSAIAGALGIQLEKTGHYQLGDRDNTLTVGMIGSSIRIMIAITIIWNILILCARGIYLAAA